MIDGPSGFGCRVQIFVASIFMATLATNRSDCHTWETLLRRPDQEVLLFVIITGNWCFTAHINCYNDSSRVSRVIVKIGFYRISVHLILSGFDETRVLFWAADLKFSLFSTLFVSSSVFTLNILFQESILCIFIHLYLPACKSFFITHVSSLSSKIWHGPSVLRGCKGLFDYVAIISSIHEFRFIVRIFSFFSKNNWRLFVPVRPLVNSLCRFIIAECLFEQEVMSLNQGDTVMKTLE